MIWRVFITVIWLFWICLLAYGIIAARLSPFYSIIPACWLIFLLYWWITARRVKATAEKQSVESALAHRIPVAASWFIMADWKLRYPMNIPLIPHPEWVLIAGAVICALGLFETIWARRTLAGNWSADVTFKQGHELIKTGPYRFTRHPIYTGLLMMSLGTAIEIGTVRGLVALALMTIGFWIKLRQEERLMMQHFPDQYPAYRKEVKALVPFVI
ncbi:MAG TPA: isoprenylcysteine carboxylmethyltransferase family protein [Verrucomicrobiae bacterium]|jgi:protein-S-isoprenylcysteine O-methyltransferase Ste14